MSLRPNQLYAVSGHRDLIDECAKAVIARFADALPDLRHAVILIPHQFYQAQLRQGLIARTRRHGFPALLSPTIATLNTLFRERVPLPPETLSPHECELLVANALAEHPNLLPHASRWEFARQFLRLFDELAETYPKMLPTSLNASVTAEIVNQLYAVWHTIQEQTPDGKTFYRDSLRKNTLINDAEHVFVCEPGAFSLNESAWAQRLYEAGRLTLITRSHAYGRYLLPSLDIANSITGQAFAPTPSNTQFGLFLDAAFSDEENISARARTIKSHFPNSPASQRIRVFKPKTLEQHAFGIYLQIRDWLDQRTLPIAVVSPDRKLSRRLRAILESHGIPLHDHSGWTLSTTASATAVSTLTPSGEQGFDANTLLALVRSPYCHYGVEVERVQAAGSHLEKQLTKLEAFRTFDETVKALTKIDVGDGKADQAVKDTKLIVERIDAAISGLHRLVQPRLGASKLMPLAQLFTTLFEAMQALGMDAALRRDDAGEAIVKNLESMSAAAERQGTNANWNQWRGWILHALEGKKFVPKEHRYLLELYDPSQVALVRPAGLIFAALDTDHTLPGDPLPLIDEDLRQTLGLPNHNQRCAARFGAFRTALENAGQVLLTCQRADNEKTLRPAPWLDGLQHFHTLAYGDDLEQRLLGQRTEATIRGATEATGAITASPETSQMPAPTIPSWDKKLSVGATQNALDCPYRFFVRSILKLSPAAEIERYDSPRDYGKHLHRCMAALLGNTGGYLPGPMKNPWVEKYRNHALKLAGAIVEAEFSPYLKRHYSVKERMLQTLAAIEWCIDWLIANVSTDAIFEVETPKEKELDDELRLNGRPDCVIHENDGIHILDYKTRSRRSKNTLLDGQDIQLTAYALFYDKVKAVSYMSMKDHKVVTLEGKELDEAQKQLRETLRTFGTDTATLPMPAWANDESCRYCDYGGVCRRKAWN